MANVNYSGSGTSAPGNPLSPTVQGQVQTAGPSTPKLHMSSDIFTKGKQDYIVYSTTGKPKSDDDYYRAFDRYAQVGKPPPGYTVLKDKSTASKLRDLFESVSQPLQQATKAIGGAIGEGVSSIPPGGGTSLGQPGLPVSNIPQASRREVQQQGRKLGTSAADFINQATIATPEQAGATAANITTALATGGMSGLTAPAIRVLSTAGGYGLSDLLFGSSQTISDTISKTLEVAGVAALSEGGTSVLRNAFGRGLTQRSQTQVQDDLMAMMQRRHPNMLNQGKDAVDGALSVPGTLSEVVDIGAKALRGNTRETSEALMQEMVNVFPRALRKSTRDSVTSKLASALDDYVEATNSILNNLGDDAAIQTAVTSQKSAQDAIMKVLHGEFARPNQKVTNTGYLFKVANIIGQFTNNQGDLASSMIILDALKRSGINKGFNAEAFQVTLRNLQQRSPLIREAGKIAGRGADIFKSRSTLFKGIQEPNMDRPYTGGIKGFSVPMPLTGSGRIPLYYRGGDKFVGKVRGVQPKATSPTLIGIEQYVKEE